MHDYLDRPVLLSTGTRWPIGAVAGCLGLLGSFLEEPETRPLVTNLRQLCFGLEIAPERLSELSQAGLLRVNGTLDPLMRDVVLAAVRGTGNNLYLDPPFTEPLDRTIAELVLARDHIQASLPREMAEVVLGYDPLHEGAEQIQRSGRWADRLTDRNPAGGTPPLPE